MNTDFSKRDFEIWQLAMEYAGRRLSVLLELVDETRSEDLPGPASDFKDGFREGWDGALSFLEAPIEQLLNDEYNDNLLQSIKDGNWVPGE